LRTKRKDFELFSVADVNENVLIVLCHKFSALLYWTVSCLKSTSLLISQPAKRFAGIHDVVYHGLGHT